MFEPDENQFKETPEMAIAPILKENIDELKFKRIGKGQEEEFVALLKTEYEAGQRLLFLVSYELKTVTDKLMHKKFSNDDRIGLTYLKDVLNGWMNSIMAYNVDISNHILKRAKEIAERLNKPNMEEKEEEKEALPVVNEHSYPITGDKKYMLTLADGYTYCELVIPQGIMVKFLDSPDFETVSSLRITPEDEYQVKLKNPEGKATWKVPLKINLREIQVGGEEETEEKSGEDVPSELP